MELENVSFKVSFTDLFRKMVDDSMSFEVEDSHFLAEDETTKYPRFDWLDQFRGMCVVLYIIAIITWGLSGEILEGVLPIGPTYYNHGWAISLELFDQSPFSFPPMITIIDLGQPNLMFLVGFMQAYSFSRREKNISKKSAWIHVVNRFGLLMVTSVLFEDILLSHGLFSGIFTGTFASLAWASLFGGISAAYIKKADYRILTGILIMIIHAVLYTIPGLNTWKVGSGFYIFQIPWKMINLSAIAIVASGFTLYFFGEDGKLKEENILFKSRILPLCLSMFAINYLMDYLQWADSLHCTTSLAFLTIAISSLGLFTFYQFDRYEFKIPFFSAFGKNMWLMFILSPLLEWILIALIQDLVASSRILALILAGILPLAMMGGIAKLLDKKKILVKI